MRMTGRIEWLGGWEIEVDGYKAIRYIEGSKAEVIRDYRQRFGLQGKHIAWREYLPNGKGNRPTNLYDAVIEGLRAGVITNG